MESWRYWHARQSKTSWKLPALTLFQGADSQGAAQLLLLVESVQGETFVGALETREFCLLVLVLLGS